MSTPSGKPFDPFDLSPYAPKRVRDRSILERPSYPSDDHQSGPDDQVGGDSEAVATAASDVARDSPAEDTSQQYALDLDAGDPARAPSPAQPIDLARRAEPADGDIDRLQSSVRYLRREAGLDPEKRIEEIDAERHDSATRARLPRAGQLRAVAGLGPFDADGSCPRTGQYINGLRVPPSLTPKHLRRPETQRRDYLRGPMRVLLAGVIATPIAYYFSIASPGAPSEPAGSSSLASFAARLVASAEFPPAKAKLKAGEAEAFDAMVSSRNKLVVRSSPDPASAITLVAPAVPPAAELPASQDVATPAVRALDRATVQLLLQQGEQLVAAGDLVSARQVYQRAAEAGNAAAALALGATFDPVVLGRIGMQSIGADVEKARSWYEKARQFGSADAPHRLETLANR
jgi:hypothetical protein